MFTVKFVPPQFPPDTPFKVVPPIDHPVNMKALSGYYQLLGVSSTSKITEVKTAFKKKSLAFLPDRWVGKQINMKTAKSKRL